MRHVILRVLGVAGILATATMLHAQSADVIFVHGRIYSGEEDQGKQRMQAMAVRGGRVQLIGSDFDAQKLKGPHTQVVDLGGKFVMPGFNDAHLHLASGGSESLNVNLVGAASLQEMKKRIAQRATTAAAGEWVIGQGWDHTLWSEKKLPTRSDLDEVTGNHPAVFTRVDGHISVANTAALRVSNITKDTKDPAGGKIDRDQAGEATGILRESARNLLTQMPRETAATRRKGMELALQDAARWGVTSAQDNSGWEDFLVLEDLEREGKLTLRVTEWLPFTDPVEVLERKRQRHERSDTMLHTGMLKGFMDGSLGSRTAALLAPYADDPGNTGLPQFDAPTLNRMARERALAGFQIGLHAIGDRGTQMALDAFAEAERAVQQQGHEGKGLRFRVEHAQVVAPADFARFKDLGVIASMQPNHLLTDMNWAEERIGRARAKDSYAWAEFLKNGVRLAFGTDYPVEPITPFRGLYAAVTRRNEAGNKEYFPEQKLSIEQAIAAYTTGSAYAESTEGDKGTLRAGKLADFVVLDRDITTIDAKEILGTKVVRTVVGGRTVFEAR